MTLVALQKAGWHNIPAKAGSRERWFPVAIYQKVKLGFLEGELEDSWQIQPT